MVDINLFVSNPRCGASPATIEVGIREIAKQLLCPRFVVPKFRSKSQPRLETEFVSLSSHGLETMSEHEGNEEERLPSNLDEHAL